jgi:Cu+-exporting ATPase
LALSAPFTFGHIMRILGKNQFYVKDTLTIEKLAKINTLVFDKTGTITHNKESNIRFQGNEMKEFDKLNLKSLLKNSNHPLSKSLYAFFALEDAYFPVENFTDTPGKGYSAIVRGQLYKIGSASFVGQDSVNLETAVYISKNDEFLGKFIFKNEYRKNIKNMFGELSNYQINILSGDNASEENQLKILMKEVAEMRFNQSPEDKLNFIQKLQQSGQFVAMFGDGLNDAGALKQSNVGIAIADDTNSFTPSSDVIMKGDRIIEIKKYLDLSKDAVFIVKSMFVVSFLYNIVGLSFAITGNLSPLVCAILMPISSITVVALTSVLTWTRSMKYFH